MQSTAGLTSLPNLLTYARIIMIPLVGYLLVTGDPALRIIAFVLYALAAFTDWLDGYLARKWQQSSPLGRMLDPIADKLLVGTLIVLFAWDGTFSSLDLIPAIAILLREIFVSGLREFMGTTNIVVPVTRLAKWKTTVQLVAIGAAFLEIVDPALRLVSEPLLWLAAVMTIITGAQYFASAWPHLSGGRS